MSPTDILTPSEADGMTANYAVVLADGSTQVNVGESVTLRASTTVRRSRTIRWSSSNTGLVSVSSVGTITGRTAGTATVTALGSNGSSSRFPVSVVTTTTRTAPVVAVVDITVPSTTMTVGGMMTLSATARDSAGAAITGRTVTWSGSGSAVTVGSTGVVTAVAAGSADVRATVDGVAAARTITVGGATPSVTSFVISPKTGVSLTQWQNRQFTASVTWSDAATRAVAVSYSTNGGYIDSNGWFTAGGVAGTFMVIANCACGRADTAAVIVSSTATTPTAQLTALRISPKSVSLAAGASQQFTATANWSTGATTLPPITYSVTGGTVSAGGLFVAPSTAGTYRVIVAHSGGTLRDTAVVTVASAPPDLPPGSVNVLFFDDFESGGFARVQNGIRWTGTPWIENSDRKASSGARSARFRQGDSGDWGELRFGGLPQLTEVFLQFKLYQPSGLESPTLGPRVRVTTDNRNDKFFRLWGQDYDTGQKVGASTWGSGGTGNLGTEFRRRMGADWWSIGQGGDDMEQQPKFPLIGADRFLGKWTTVRIRVKVPSAANNDGVIQIWVDGEIASDLRNAQNYPIGGVGNFFETGYLLGWANSGFQPGQMMFVDDFSISTGGFPPN